jgi:hypothetical protein
MIEKTLLEPFLRSVTHSIGSNGWVRFNAWICVVSSRLRTTAPPGGSRYRVPWPRTPDPY